MLRNPLIFSKRFDPKLPFDRGLTGVYPRV